MHSGGFVWKHFKNNTLYCGDSFQPARSYYGFERWGWQGRWAGARGRFCLICHQRPGDPHPLSCPLPTHSSIFPPFMGAHQSSSTAAGWIEGNERSIDSSDPKNVCNSRRSRRGPAQLNKIYSRIKKKKKKLHQTQRLKMSRKPRLEIPVGTGL